MAIEQPISTDKLNSPSHSLLHRIIAADSAAAVKSLVVTSNSDVVIAATKKFFVDGSAGVGGDTYLYEVSANVLALVAGAVEGLRLGTSEVVINEAGAAIDFRVEGDTISNLLFIQGSTDLVGIGITPLVKFHILNSTTVEGTPPSPSSSTIARLQKNATSVDPCNIELIAGTAANAGVSFGDKDAILIGRIVYSNASDLMSIVTNGTSAVRYDSGQRTLLGPQSVSVNVGATARKVQIFGTDLAGASQSIVRGSTDTGPAEFILGKSRSTTSGAFSIVSSGDQIGRLLFAADDGVDWDSYAAGITVEVDGTPGSNDMPGRMIFSTTLDGSATSTERMRIDNAGRVTIGGIAAGTVNSIIPGVQVFSSDDKASVLISRGTADTTGSKILLNKSRNTTFGSFTIVNQNDVLGEILFTGDDGVDYTSVGASIKAIVSATPGSNDMPGSLLFSTTADGADTVTERMRINHAGQILIGGITPQTVTADARWQMFGTDGASSQMTLARGSADANAASLQFLKSRNTSYGSFSIVSASDEIGALIFNIDDGVDYSNPAAKISAFVDGTPGSNDAPGRLSFYTTPDGSVTLAERFRMENDGTLSAQTASYENLVTANNDMPNRKFVTDYTGKSIATEVSLTDAATIATDASLGSVFYVTLGGNRTLGTPTNPTAGQKAIWRLIQDATGGRTITLSSAFRVSADIGTITLSTGANAIDYIGGEYNGVSSKWDLVAFSKNVV